MFDLVVVGSGIAGLSAAVRAAATGLSVLVLTKGELSQSATRYAQGGVAAALSPSDSPDGHLADTLAAGAGLCDVDAVRVLVDEGPARVRELQALGAAFDTAGPDGVLALAREGGHSLARVVHAGGDATGAEIERALVASVRAADAIEVREGWFATALRVEAGRCSGVHVVDARGRKAAVGSLHTLLATGGAGQLYAVTTNPRLSTGDGVAMALAAGVAVADVEFMQFHPTALHTPTMPRPLVSEALRGEGAVLRDGDGDAFMAEEHPMADLAPRDVVSRAMARRMVDRGLDHLWLDATGIADFGRHFPTITASCREIGLDPQRDWLPVAPAAHYMSGGVATDLDGATTLPGLWACGETACSGVHGANRLASNSLLDGLVFAPRVVAAIGRGKDGPDRTGVLRGVAGHDPAGAPDASDAPPPVPEPSQDPPGAATATALSGLQAALTRFAGVLRDSRSLARAAAAVEAVAADPGASGAGRGAHELRGLIAVARVLVAAATAREESRGAHTRVDHPSPAERFLGRFVAVGRGATGATGRGAGAGLTFTPLAAAPRPEVVR